MRRSIETHLAGRQVSHVVYGTIIGLALVVALEAHPPGAGAVAGSLLATALAVGLAEVYSDVLGAETRTRHRVARPRVREIVTDAGAVAAGIATPAAFFILAAFGVMEVGTAFTAAKWSGFALTGFYGFAAARLSGAGVVASLLQAVAVGAVGGFLIVLKALIH